MKFAARPAPAIQKSHDEKLITIKSTAPLKVSDSPIDKPKEPETQKDLPSSTNSKEEKITGIAFPGAFPSPFQNFQTRGEDFFMQHNAEMTAQQLHQQMVMQNADRQRMEREATLKLKQLETMLMQLAVSHPEHTGHCFIEGRLPHQQATLRCDNPELLEIVRPHQGKIFEFLDRTPGASRNIIGFTFTGHPNRLIILN